MPIQFNEIVATRVPGQRVEIDNSLAGQAGSGLPYRALLIGPGTDGGSGGVAKTLDTVTSPDEVAASYGRGSFLHLMAKAYYRNAPGTELGVIASAIEALATGTNKATGTLTVTVTTAKAGTVYLYIGGQRVLITVTAGLTDAQIASAIKEVITPTSGTSQYPDLPVVASVADAVVTLTAKNIGAIGDTIDVRFNYYAGEQFPSGVSIAVSAMTGGGSDPDISSGSPSLIDNLGDNWYHVWASAYNDTANITAIHDELERRFNGMASIDGICFMGEDDTVSNLVTKHDGLDGSGKNSKELCVIDAYGYLTTPFEVAAAAAGRVLSHLLTGSGQESAPFQTEELVGVMAPAENDRRIETERKTLLESGVATLKVDSGGRVRIERLVTNYMASAAGAADTSWLDVNTRFTAMFLRWDWDTYITNKYPQAKLASDDTRISAGQSVMTPAIGKAEAITRFRYWESLGLVENFDQFKKTLKSERSVIDVNTMDWMMQPDFVNQFRCGRTRLSFRL